MNLKDSVFRQTLEFFANKALDLFPKPKVQTNIAFNCNDVSLEEEKREDLGWDVWVGSVAAELQNAMLDKSCDLCRMKCEF